ncbi:ribosomal protein S7 domain-containing protein [Phlyctochytrium arcticum]|nr:ribosomal protein S7 domain-containing protein [Phlyctochytrium arcticum]
MLGRRLLRVCAQRVSTKAVFVPSLARPVLFRALTQTTSENTQTPTIPSSPTEGLSSNDPLAGIDFTTGHAARLASILEPQQTSTTTPSSSADLTTNFRTDLVKKTPKSSAERRNVQLSIPEAFVNNIMKDGKKARARRILQDALDHVQRETGDDPMVVLDKVVNRVGPLIKTVAVKRGGKNVPTPKPLNDRQRIRQGILWIIQAASGKNARGAFGERIGKEMIAVMNDESEALNRRENTHKQALANRSNVVMFDRKVRR